VGIEPTFSFFPRGLIKMDLLTFASNYILDILLSGFVISFADENFHLKEVIGTRLWIFIFSSIQSVPLILFAILFFSGNLTGVWFA
jgi:hypothetical protein